MAENDSHFVGMVPEVPPAPPTREQRMEALLREREWSHNGYCPWCMRQSRHAETCALAAALAP